MSDDLLAGVNILPKLDTKKVNVQAVNISLAGKALRSSVGTVVSADSADPLRTDVR